ncbi:hypothetical protein N7527_009718 [Penicillium freii]|nr:hypothetical protein N7527_009718 [Penicillium freii]
MLWDKKNEMIVNNESGELMRMFYSAFDDLLPPQLQEPNLPGGGLYPSHLRREIDEWNALIHSNLNAGVYNVGMASNQDQYNESVDKLFATMDQIERRLQSSGPYLFGDFLTETDIRLYTTVSRFDVAYYPIFRCNLKMVRLDYPAIDMWYRSLYYDESSRTSGAFKTTTNFFAVRSRLMAMDCRLQTTQSQIANFVFVVHQHKFGYTKLFASKMGGNGDIIPAGPAPAILPLGGTNE